MSASEIDARLSRIARDRLGIQTLLTRGSDRLDFHEVAVSCLLDALRAAFDAGAAAALGEKE